MTKISQLLERAMQVIVALRWGAHHTGEVHPEVEAEVRETLSLLYGAKRDVDASDGAVSMGCTSRDQGDDR